MLVRGIGAAALLSVGSVAGALTSTGEFCDLLRAPQFDKVVEVGARYELGEHGAYLSHPSCPTTYDDRVGVGFADIDGASRTLRDYAVHRLSEVEFGGKANVKVVGLLRDAPLRGFSWYRYRLDVIRFERIDHVVEPYAGLLQAGNTYRTAVRGDRLFGLALVEPVRVPLHYAIRMEWTNRAAFPALVRLRLGAPALMVTFSVVGDQIRQVTEQRWSRTLKLKVLAVE